MLKIWKHTIPFNTKASVQDPLWNMPQGLHWSDWQDAGAPTQGAQEGLNIRQCVPIEELAMDESHTIKWEEAEVVNYHPHYQQKCALEAWHIWTEWHKMNREMKALCPVTYTEYKPLVHLSHLHPPHWPDWTPPLLLVSI